MKYKRSRSAWEAASSGARRATMFHGDCAELLAAIPDDSVQLVVTSPPYCMGKDYETGNDLTDFIEAHDRILPEIMRVIAPGGSVCWQVGYHVTENIVTPLDYLVFDAIRKLESPPVLRNRIVWTYGHGHHCPRRFSGRHEVILWFTKGNSYTFDLDAVRVPQLYPGKRSTYGPNQGDFSGNPLGKNPEDVWDIPNVKANHVEKTVHPCQFPVTLAQRLIKALTNKDDLVLDPFAGVASTGVAAVMAQRRFLGAEIDDLYVDTAILRLKQAQNGSVRIREDKPVMQPNPNTSVAKRPDHFWPQSTSTDS